MPHCRFIFLALLLFPFTVKSQSLVTDDGIKHWEGGSTIGLNNDGFGFDVKFTYFPVQYVGLKMGLGFASEIWELADYLDEEEIDNDYTTRFKFNPAIVLRSPRIAYLKRHDAGFYLFAEPGIVLSPGASGSHDAKWARWDFKCGINIQHERFIFTIGYGISNFSLYSGSPVNHWGASDRTNYITHSGFIGGGVKF